MLYVVVAYNILQQAERKAGEMLRDAKAAGEIMTPERSQRTDLVANLDQVKPATLSEIGITTATSSGVTGEDHQQQMVASPLRDLSSWEDLFSYQFKD
jgi:hypothetical protein